MFKRKTHTILHDISNVIHKDTASSAIVSVFCRSAPFLGCSETEIERNKIESWEKEIEACLGVDRPQVLDYSVWFSPDPLHAYQPLSPALPSAFRHNTRIRAAFTKWKKSMEGRRFFPQLQDAKTLSRATAAKYHEIVHENNPELFDNAVTSAMLERWYAKTGYEIGGPCEARQAWGFNDITPRTYFAGGGTTFHDSKYIRPVINSLANSFPETGFISRYSTNDLILEKTILSFVYDYRSFTSNLTEFKHFLADLACFCDDIRVQIVDSREGVLNVSLGSLIREYNQTCNIDGHFTLNRYITGLFEEFRHNRAGFLGVYGNITGCTVLHGLHACQLCGDKSECKCVGDDVYGIAQVGEGYTRYDLIEGIQELGEIQVEKVQFWDYRPLEEDENDDRAYPYCKRPFDRFENRMILEQSIFLPIFGALVPIAESFRSDEEMDQHKRIKVLCRQTHSVIEQCRNMYPELDFHQVNLIRGYLDAMYTIVGLPKDGRLPFESFISQRKERTSGLLVPCIEGDFLGQTQWDLLSSRWEHFGSPLVRIPVCVRDRIDGVDLMLRDRTCEVETCMNERIVYLEKMEWAVSTPMHEIRYMDYPEYSAFYDSLFLGELFPLYRVRTCFGAPSWIKELVY